MEGAKTLRLMEGALTQLEKTSNMAAISESRVANPATAADITSSATSRPAASMPPDPYFCNIPNQFMEYQYFVSVPFI